MKGAETLLALLKAGQKLFSFGFVTNNSYHGIEFAFWNESRLAFARNDFFSSEGTKETNLHRQENDL